MKFSTTTLGFVLSLSAVMAAPLKEREIHTEIATFYETYTHVVHETTTVYVAPTPAAKNEYAAYSVKSYGTSTESTSTEATSTSESTSTSTTSTTTSSTTSTVEPTTSTPEPTTQVSTTFSTSTSTSSTSTEVPTTTAVVPSFSALAFPTPTTTQQPAVTSAVVKAVETATGNSGSGSGSFAGEMTYYATGLGSCGATSYDTDYIVAASYLYMKNGINPNKNPLCNTNIKIIGPLKTLIARIVDTCPGCNGMYDLDCSPKLFKDLGCTEVQGRCQMTWSPA